MASRFLTRRRFLAASGATLATASPLALAACGDSEDDEISPAREAELLNAVLAQQLAVFRAAELASGNAPTELQPTLDRVESQRKRSGRALEQAITKLDGTPAGTAADPVGAESPAEGLARQLEISIAAALEAIGELSSERRTPVHRAISEDAAALAAIRATLGEEIAPDPFVMGPPAGKAAA